MELPNPLEFFLLFFQLSFPYFFYINVSIRIARLSSSKHFHSCYKFHINNVCSIPYWNGIAIFLCFVFVFFFILFFTFFAAFSDSVIAFLDFQYSRRLGSLKCTCCFLQCIPEVSFNSRDCYVLPINYFMIVGLTPSYSRRVHHGWIADDFNAAYHTLMTCERYERIHSCDLQ